MMHARGVAHPAGRLVAIVLGLAACGSNAPREQRLVVIQADAGAPPPAVADAMILVESDLEYADRLQSTTDAGVVLPNNAPAVGSGAPVKPGPRGRITVTDRAAYDESTLVPDDVVARIKSAYLAGLERCYQAELAVQPKAKGKLKLTFTINGAGRTVSPQVEGFAPKLGACVENQIAVWLFPSPKDPSGQPTDAAFGVTLTLAPK